MTRAGDATRARLLRAGEKLFARHGIDRVPLRELYEEAGQRNSSALHYHFGSREGLLAAIREHHLAAIEAHRRQLLDALDEPQEPPPDRVAAITHALAAPLLDELDTPSGRDFLRIVPMLMERPGHHLHELTTTPPETTRALESLRAEFGELPRPVLDQRLVDVLRFMAIALSDRARTVESDVEPLLAAEDFERNLVHVLVSVLRAPW